MFETEPDKVSMAQFIDEMMEERELSNLAVAVEVGFGNPKVVELIRRGAIHVPLEKIPDLAEAIGADRRALMDRALRQYIPGALDAMMVCYGRITDNEHDLISLVREISKDSDPSPWDVQEKLKGLFSPT